MNEQEMVIDLPGLSIQRALEGLQPPRFVQVRLPLHAQEKVPHGVYRGIAYDTIRGSPTHED
jgi:hypothetical protein